MVKYNNTYRVHFGKYHLCVSKEDYERFNLFKGRPNEWKNSYVLLHKYTDVSEKVEREWDKIIHHWKKPKSSSTKKK